MSTDARWDWEMHLDLPPLPNHRTASAMASFIADMHRAFDLVSLELHFHLAGAYLAALNDVQAISTVELQGSTLVLDSLYREHFRRLGSLDLL